MKKDVMIVENYQTTAVAITINKTMCGLIAFMGRPTTKEAATSILDQYEMQASRGRQGFGLIEIAKTGIKIKRSMTEPRAMMDIAMSEAKMLMFHHRFPTSTSNLHGQTHPMYITNKELEFDWYVMHNGVISNDSELKLEHENLGYKYLTEIEEEYQYSKIKTIKFNDSEAFAIEIARFLEAKDGMIKTQGSAAFLALKVNKISGKPISLIIGRNKSNPLDVELKEEGILIASNIAGDKKVEVPANIALEIDIKNLTSKSETFGQMGEYMPLVFAPEPVRIYPKSIMGFGSNESQFHRHTEATLPMKINLQDEKDGLDEEIDPEFISEKEEAFYRMQDRIVGDIEEEVTLLMSELMVEDLDDDVVKQYADRITETIMGTRERAAKCRDYFDKQLEKEIESYTVKEGQAMQRDPYPYDDNSNF